MVYCLIFFVGVALETLRGFKQQTELDVSPVKYSASLVRAGVAERFMVTEWAHLSVSTEKRF